MAFEQSCISVHGRITADVAGERSHLIAVIDEILTSTEAGQGPTAGYETWPVL